MSDKDDKHKLFLKIYNSPNNKRSKITYNYYSLAGENFYDFIIDSSTKIMVPRVGIVSQDVFGNLIQNAGEPWTYDPLSITSFKRYLKSMLMEIFTLANDSPDYAKDGWLNFRIEYFKKIYKQVHLLWDFGRQHLCLIGKVDITIYAL